MEGISENTDNSNTMGVKSINAVLVVLGDIGHSPRMCFHALSLAQHGFNVELVGYLNSNPHQRITQNTNIKLIPITTPPRMLIYLPRFMSLPIKFFWMFFTLFFALLLRTSKRSSIIISQNPPGIPTMFVCYIISKMKGARFVIDWHNYTFSMINHSSENGEQKDTSPKSNSNQSHTRAGSPIDRETDNKKNKHHKPAELSKFAKFAHNWEGYWGKRAFCNICVSRSMQRDLRDRWGIGALTLYDKAPNWMFRLLSIEEQHKFLLRLLDVGNELGSKISESKVFNNTSNNYSNSGYFEETLCTYRDDNGIVHLKESRPLLLVSSTSWTPDEDFGLLLDALRDYDRNVQQAILDCTTERPMLPKILAIITGKGPQKAYYLERISKLHLHHVHIVTAWLEAEDYPRLLGCANIGVSLHTSTSGLDLPMKVIDMFGCSCPVLAKRFPAIGELVHDGVNGQLFDTPHELKQTLVDLATGFPTESHKLDKLKSSFSSHLQANWENNWDAVLWPLLQKYQGTTVENEKEERWNRFQKERTEDEYESPKERSDNNINE